MKIPGNDRTAEIRALMEQRILVFDGAMGTMIQARDLDSDDFGGAELDGCNEALVLSRPDVILDIHRAYLCAGADIIETNTFGGSPLVLAEYGLADRTVELNRRAGELARTVAHEMSDAVKPRFVAGSIGPTTKAISVTGGVGFGELVDTFEAQALGLLQGGVDLFLIETCQDTRNTKAALIAVEAVCRRAGVHRPTIVSGTIEPTGTTLGGQTADAFAASLEHRDLLALGLNCATGPEFMTDHLRSLHEMVGCALSCYPNAGLPNEEGVYLETPAMLASSLERFADAGWLNMVGGCCGTTDRHIAAIASMTEGKMPRRMNAERPQRVFFSGVDLVESTEENRPLLVGERTNVIGSRKFKRLICEEKWEEATEIARRQVDGGAQIVDVCLQTTERDELEDIEAFYGRLIRAVRAPLMIDTTDPEAVELALTYCQGKAIINSINLEDGEARFEAITPLARRYGAAVVVGMIDEDPDQAQAFTRERKLQVAVVSHDLLTSKYLLQDGDLIFDPLVFPVGSGDEAYVGGAVETIEGLRLIKRRFPDCRTILGISNVSFGLPPAAREVVNSVFLYHCTRAGLDLAIVNSEKIKRFGTLNDDERQMAEDLLFNRPPARGEYSDAPADWREQSALQRSSINRLHVERVAEHFRGSSAREETRPELPLDDRLARYILEGTREGLVEDLQRKLNEKVPPLKVINGPLMAGMAEVGRLFNSNQLIVAEVLRSAESMKVAVAFLEEFMDAEDSRHRGTLVLATVKGDVHDIGKNLVEIILSNNGYRVVDLGIKVSPGQLIEAVAEEKPDAIGLSGLLVKSAQQMVVTAEDLKHAGVNVPIIVGGAALSPSFVRRKIAPVYGGSVLYCSDAMAGLETMNRLMDPALREGILRENQAESTSAPSPTIASNPSRQLVSRGVSDIAGLPVPCGRRISEPLDLEEVWSFLNPQMLYGKHLGLRGSVRRKMEERDPKALELHEVMLEIQAQARMWMQVSVVWRFFESEADGEVVSLFEPGTAGPIHRLEFPRQSAGKRLCLADFVASGDGRDSVALFVVTAGKGVREVAEAAKSSGEFLKCHAIQALALETAEAAAEMVHSKIRHWWGFPDAPELSMRDRFAGHYRGLRFSPGYPACPDLDQQADFFRLLQPEEIGVQLTEGMMMEPEASVSAIVFHHPEARYFSVKD